ncbi:hypothetical protein BKA01_006089 [Pseudonocardia eucalypti]|nr:hypothetical protein [Pseudonocardia eucalypti]
MARQTRLRDVAITEPSPSVEDLVRTLYAQA